MIHNSDFVMHLHLGVFSAACVWLLMFTRGLNSFTEEGYMVFLPARETCSYNSEVKSAEM